MVKRACVGCSDKCECATNRTGINAHHQESKKSIILLDILKSASKKIGIIDFFTLA
jgi:hypothetical protein